MDSTASFGYWLRRRRKARDLTQAALARQVGCAVVTIRKIEADAIRPSVQIAEKLAECLAIPAEERVAFLKTARATLSPDQLPLPIQPVNPAAATPATLDVSQHALPSGTVTFLFTDIEGSTALWEQHPQAMRAALARHDAILRDAVEAHAGAIFKTVGDAICAAFTSAPDALASALDAQRALHAEDWGPIGAVRVRMALHTGTAQARSDDYLGPPLNRIARLMAVGHGGQVLLSHATQELVHDDLPPGVALQDLGEHRLKDLTRPEQIFQLLAADLSSSFPPLNTLDARRTNLPAQPTPLIGREREVAAVCALLQRSDAHLVTLTGPGGVGKTRLGIQVAAELIDDFAHGVFFVDLAPIREPVLVTSAIATTLGVRESGGQPLLTTLKDYLHVKRMLLLLDNFEQVVGAAPLVTDMLAAARQLKVLVTSREVLHLRGEKEVAVAPLALPNQARLPALDHLSQYAAVSLFIERALDARPDFQVTNANAPAVAEICVRLDGLPLAIELASTRLKLFSPEALLARLSSRLPVLTGGPRDLPARQQTIRNTIDWSYDLLNETEQTLLRQLAVFVGGRTLEAAEAVCSIADNTSQLAGDQDQSTIYNLQSAILEGLAALVDKSLLRQAEGADEEPRFVMLETIREYALERLEQSGEAQTIRQQHAQYYLALAEAAEPGPWEVRQHQGSLVQLEPEHDNLRAALGWSQGPAGSAETGLRLAGTLGEFWFAYGHLSEGRAWLAGALAQPWAAAPSRTRAKALGWAGWIAMFQGDGGAADAYYGEALALCRALGDRHGSAATLTDLGLIAMSRGEYAPAAMLCEESLALFRELGDRYVSCPPIPYPLIGMTEIAIEGIRMRQNVSQLCTDLILGFTAFLWLESPQIAGGSDLADTTVWQRPRPDVCRGDSALPG